MKYIFATVTLFFSANAFAGEGSSCHFHGDKPAAESSVIECAVKRKETLISKGKIDGSWKAINQDKVEQITSKKGKKEWKVTFKDPAAKDKTKETLYMFFSISGNFLASNFTGE